MKPQVAKIILALCIVLVLGLLVANIFYAKSFWNHFFGMASNLMILVVFILAWRAVDKNQQQKKNGEGPQENGENEI